MHATNDGKDDLISFNDQFIHVGWKEEPFRFLLSFYFQMCGFQY